MTLVKITGICPCETPTTLTVGTAGLSLPHVSNEAQLCADCAQALRDLAGVGLP